MGDDRTNLTERRAELAARRRVVRLVIDDVLCPTLEPKLRAIVRGVKLTAGDIDHCFEVSGIRAADDGTIFLTGDQLAALLGAVNLVIVLRWGVENGESPESPKKGGRRPPRPPGLLH